MRLLKGILGGLVGAGITLAGASAASAGGFADKHAADRYHSPTQWGGLYFGGHVGYAWADLDWGLDYPFGDPPASSGFDFEDAIKGGHIGLQHQWGSWVVGAEVSLSGGFGRETINDVNLFGASTAGVLQTDIDWLFTATARVGYGWDRWLAYVRGGYAGAMVSLSADDNVPPDFGFKTRDFHSGWTVGAGLEHMLWDGIILGVEYNYIDLSHDGDNTVVVLASGASTGTTASSDVDTSIHSVTARLSFKLGRAEAVREPPPLK